jgi:hypothetical protein
MNLKYPDLEPRVLEAIRAESVRVQKVGKKYNCRPGEVPMQLVVQAVRETYETPPNKSTVWRAIRSLAVSGRVKTRTQKVVREFTEYYLSFPKETPMKFEEEFSLKRRGEKLLTAAGVRNALRDIKIPEIQLTPEEALSRRTEGELAALAECARINFERLLEPTGERSYKLRC